ncbi:MAG: DegV family protein [Nocardioides sp.]|nr:DegV family protein [Nocardioides sp.]
MPKVAIITDSTASLCGDVLAETGIRVVPLQVIIGATSYAEGVDEGASPTRIAEALKKFTPVSTSKPTPALMLEAYEAAIADGATEIIAIHISAAMSGTYDSAEVAAREASVPVHTLDTRQVGPATGYAAVAAAAVLDRGGSAEEAIEAARQQAAASASLFYVDTLEYLRRGGRVGAAAALLGGALAVKPLLRIDDGEVGTLEKVRTAGKALGRLEDLAVEAAGDAAVEVTVAHLANPARAEHLAEKLDTRIDVTGSIRIAELGAVLGAHVGPGMVAVCVTPAID